MSTRRKRGSWSNVPGSGAAYRFLVDHVGDGDGECLIWPFSRVRGYGNFGYRGKNYYAHRFMCELANGPRPTPAHEAAHSCGNGLGGCVHPRHLIWKTKPENVQDSWFHTPKRRNRYGRTGKLTDADVAAIRALRGKKTHDEIAAQFDVSRPTIVDVLTGRTHKT